MNTPQPLSWKIRLAIFIPLMLMGSMPLFVYFQFEHESILLLMWLTLIVVQFVLSIRTARLAIHMMAGVRKRDGKRIHLDMTPNEAKAYPRKVLAAVFRVTWLDHVMLALPRLGVAVGFTQYFRFASYAKYGYVFNVDPFIYYSLPAYKTQNLSIEPILLMLVILILISLAESISTCLIGIFITSRQSIFKRNISIFKIKLFVIVCSIIIFTLSLSFVQNTMYKRTSANLRSQITACNSPVDDDRLWVQELKQSGRCSQLELDLTNLRITETIQMTSTIFVDNGVLLGANIMRPPLVAFEYNWLPFVFRNILSALLAFGIYGVMIVAMLRVACRRLVRQATDMHNLT